MNDNTNQVDWQPSIQRDILISRASLLESTRNFFKQKRVLEVDTPTLSRGTITDVYLEALSTSVATVESKKTNYYLQTSPEFAMKRLLAAGSGSIYQICHAYRDDELGKYHNPEFLMLEWYRLDFTHIDLMHEMSELLVYLLDCKPAETISYQQLFIDILNIDPLLASDQELQNAVTNKVKGPNLACRDQLLQCLFASLIEPFIAQERPLIVKDFPASQSALARLSKSDPRVAERFEVYFKGVELANGFHELKDPSEQRQRFETDNKERLAQGKAVKPIDERLIAALSSGLPDCSGVALGLDRLLMIKLNKSSITEVLPFPIDIA